MSERWQARGWGPRAYKKMLTINRTEIETPLGPMVALASDDGLCALESADPDKRLPRLEARLRRWFPPHEIVDAETRTFSHTRTWLLMYFDGAAADVGDLPLDMHGAPFETRVWRAPLGNPSGHPTRYGPVLEETGSARGAPARRAAHRAHPPATIRPRHPR